MTKYTQEQLVEFRGLVELGESHDQLDRIRSRLSMREFVARVGKEKCVAMFEILKAETEGDEE